MMNKRGGEKILSIWWFFVLAVIGGAIVLGVLVFYSAEINVKSAEAEILSEKILGCLVNNGNVADNYFTSGFSVYKSCGLAENVFGKGSNFFFKIRVLDGAGKMIAGNRAEIVGGDASFEADCAIIETGTVSAKHFPMCSRKIADFERVGVKYSMIVIAGSNQDGRQEALK